MNITLVSCDGTPFSVSRQVAERSRLLREMLIEIIENDQIHGVIPVPNVTSVILGKALDFCSASVHWDDETTLGDYQAKFISELDQDTLYELILAANYLDIPDLLEAACESVAAMIRGKKPEEIRAIFGLPDDFTPEQLETIDKEMGWAFE